MHDYAGGTITSALGEEGFSELSPCAPPGSWADVICPSSAFCSLHNLSPFRCKSDLWVGQHCVFLKPHAQHVPGTPVALAQ